MALEKFLIQGERQDSLFLALPFLTGKPFSTTKDIKVTKKNLFIDAFSSFVVRLFPTNYGRAGFIYEIQGVLSFTFRGV
jgi:hypothetical protein